MVNAPKVIVTDHYECVTGSRKKNPNLYATSWPAAFFKKIGTKENWNRSWNRRRRTGFCITILRKISNHAASADWPEIILKRQREQFLGITVSLGGTSVKGFDCSGFVRNRFLLNGKILRAMRSQLWWTSGRSWDELRKSEKRDLIFLEKKRHLKKESISSMLRLSRQRNVLFTAPGCVRLDVFRSFVSSYEETLLQAILSAHGGLFPIKKRSTRWKNSMNKLQIPSLQYSCRACPHLLSMPISVNRQMTFSIRCLIFASDLVVMLMPMAARRCFLQK